MPSTPAPSPLPPLAQAPGFRGGVFHGVLLLLVGIASACAFEAPEAVYYIGFGAQRTVSGSLHVLEADGDRYLVDVGVFMGEEGSNHPWPSELPPRSLEGVFITHAHADHLGRLPLLLEEGYRGPVYMTEPTYDLARITLPQNVAFTDLGEERFYYSRHNEGQDRIPAYLPGYDFGAYTVDPDNRVHFTAARPELDSLGFYLARSQREKLADELLERLDEQVRLVELDEPFQAGAFEVTAIHTSHIPGSVMYRFERGGRAAAFTGDAGGNTSPLLPPNEPWEEEVDVLFTEGTYWGGERLDAPEEQAVFRRKVGSLVAEGYRVVIPAFVMDRSQQVLHHLDRGMASGEVPEETTVRLTSPTAHRFTLLYEEYAREAHLSGLGPFFSEEMSDAHFRPGHFVPPGAEGPAEAQDDDSLPLDHGEIGVMSSGMADHGAARQAVEEFAGDPMTAFFTVGYQAEGTLGRELREAAEEPEPGAIEVDGESVPFRAEAFHTRGFSGHASRDEIARIFGPASPETVFLVHLEPEGVGALSRFYEDAFGAEVVAPELGERHRLW